MLKGLDNFTHVPNNYKDTKPKKIYRLKEDQAFSLSLELGRREKVVRYPSADFLPLPPRRALPNLSPHLFRRGW
jgi:hypothetical protein